MLEVMVVAMSLGDEVQALVCFCGGNVLSAAMPANSRFNKFEAFVKNLV